MEHVGSYQRETKTGYLQTIDRYRARNCSGFKRFLLRGIDKVETEIGLIAMAHNLKKATLTA